MSDLISREEIRNLILEEADEIVGGYDNPDSNIMVNALLDLIDSCSTINSGEWISVNDRLPEIKKYGISEIVLAFDRKKGKCFALRYKTRQGIKWFCSGTEIVDITHWTPLPKPPEEG